MIEKNGIPFRGKKSFTLLITVLMITLFSYLAISSMHTSSFQSINLQNQYLYIQANNHKEFIKEYLKSLELRDIKHLKIDDDSFDIEAFIKKEDSKYQIDIFVNSKKYDIRVHETFTK